MLSNKKIFTTVHETHKIHEISSIHTETNTARLSPGTHRILLNHIEEFVHTIFLNFGFDYDTDWHGG